MEYQWSRGSGLDLTSEDALRGRPRSVEVR